MQDLMPPVNTPDNLFHDGNDATGVEGTVLYADYMNGNQGATRDIQLEMKNVLADAGFTPDPTKENQLLLAIQKIVGNNVAGVVRTVNDKDPDSNGNVKLGTAADADVGTAPGNVMPVGAFGMGPAGTGRATLANLLSPDKGYTGYTWSATNGDPDAPTFFPQGGTFGIQNQLWHNAEQYFALQTVWRNGRIGFRTMEANAPGAWNEFFHTGHLPTATQTGALPLTGGTMTNEIKSTSGNILRGIQGGYGAILRMDANGLYFLQTNKDDPNGNYNDKRSLTIAHDTGAVSIGTQLTVTDADFINKIGYTTYKDGGGNDHYQVGGLRLEVDGSQMAELYYNVLAGQSAEVSLHNKYGTTDSYLSLRNDGQLTIIGSNPQLYLGSSRVASDGNIQGAAWGGDWLSNYIHNLIQNIGQMSVSGTQWWATINLNGGTLIVQGGYAEVRDAEVTDRVALNIAAPNRLLGVFITNRNFAQGYATYNPQVTVLADDNGGFNFVHGQKERMMYWIAVGY